MLVAMNIAYFLAMVSLGVSATTPSATDVLPFGANFGPSTINGQWWRLLASTFIHYGIMHLGFNMWCLWSLGNLAERLFGRGRFLAIYLLSGLGGSTASLLWHPVAVSAGASGAVFGIAGGLATFLYLARIHLPERAARELLTSIVIFIAFNLAFGLTIPGIDNAGHVGGLVLGAVLGASLAHRRSFPLVACAAAAALIGSALVAKSVAQGDPNVILAEAILLADTDSPEAIEKVEQVLSEHPDLASGHALLAQVYFRDRRYQDAIAASRKALGLDPKQTAAQSVLGSALYWEGDYEAAVKELRTAIEQEPKQLPAHALLSRALRKLGRDEEGMSALEEGIKYAPTPSLLFLDLGLENLDDVEMKFLAASLKDEIEITPEDPENYNVLSLILARSGATDEALEAVRTALELAPEAPHIIDSLGTVHFYRGELDAAVKAYRDAIALSPDYGVYQYNVSVALRRRGDEREADAALAEARRLLPNLEPPAGGQPMM
jgi:rhomboid protease GluP